ncbi:hypothetical protein BST97_05815 [Nonlabens spongiae]|uniref:Uncharacterized protein n=1 Tax=Nonlabens spongiae TaxID=331648 RepID=A0A1W6MIW4_9FLAO|nr:hypothetical protein [Nonlabens spongiae]ARN77541.1 hypothetical protein BST97_05815 [Nonlabens spongiae]
MNTKVPVIASRILLISIMLTLTKVVAQDVMLKPAVDIEIAPLNPTATGQFVKWHEYAKGIAIADKNKYNEQGLTVHDGGKTIKDFINQSPEDAALDNSYIVDLDEKDRILKVTSYIDGKPSSPNTYTYDSKGQIATAKDFFGTHTYMYDRQGRLSQEVLEGKKKTVYSYDKKGKELVVTMTTTWPDKQDKSAIEVKSFENGMIKWRTDSYDKTYYAVRDDRGTYIAEAEKGKQPSYYMLKNVFYHDELKADLLTIKRIPGKSPQFYLNKKEYNTGFIVNGDDVIVHFPYDGNYYIKRNFMPNGLPNNQLLPLELFRENTPVLFKWKQGKIQIFYGNRALYSVYGNTDLKLFEDNNHWLYYSKDKATYYRIKKDVTPVEGAIIEPEVINAPFILYADTAVQQWIIIAEGTQIKNKFGYEFKSADTGEVVIVKNKIPKYTYVPTDNAKPMQIITGDFYKGQSYPK